jgi:hypothetical protein
VNYGGIGGVIGHRKWAMVLTIQGSKAVAPACCAIGGNLPITEVRGATMLWCRNMMRSASPLDDGETCVNGDLGRIGGDLGGLSLAYHHAYKHNGGKAG